MPKALITGSTGHDGSYLTEFLLAKGYGVHGLKRRSSSLNTGRLDHIYQDIHESGARFFLHYADLTDGSSLAILLYDLRPDEIYNLGAQSNVKVSFEVPEFTTDVFATGALRLLEAMRHTEVKCRFYQASSSEMFGSAPPAQSETTPFQGRQAAAEAAERQRTEVKQAEQRRLLWVQQWMQYALNSLPYDARREVEMEVHAMVQETLCVLQRSQPEAITRRLVVAAVHRALGPWVRKQEMERALKAGMNRLAWDVQSGSEHPLHRGGHQTA